MIESLTVTNHVGESLTINLRDPFETGLIIKEISGLGPPDADINYEENGSMDGGYYTGARLQTRDIQIRFVFDWASTVEESRHRLYKYFPIKRKVTLAFETETRSIYISGYVEKNEVTIFNKQASAAVTILCPDPAFKPINGAQTTTFSGSEGEFEFEFENSIESSVETVNTLNITCSTITLTNMQNIRVYIKQGTLERSYIPVIDDAHTMHVAVPTADAESLGQDEFNVQFAYKDQYGHNQISEIATATLDIQIIQGSSQDALVMSERYDHHTKLVDNIGDLDVGMKISIHINDLGEDTMGNITIYDVNTQEYFRITAASVVVDATSGILSGDDIYISTVKGSKSITLLRSGAYYNIINALDRTSTWLQLPAGGTQIAYYAASGTDAMEVTIEYTPLYEGV